MTGQEDYLHLLQDLLPPGQAWNREADSNLTKVLNILAAELENIDARALAIIEEADPRTTFEMLTDWERVAGLPDACTPAAVTLQERHAALVQKITGIGGQSEAYFIGVAEALGYDGITITTYKPFIAGIGECSVDLLMGGHDVRYNWKVTVPGLRAIYFRTGISECGDTLVTIDRAEDLECVLNRLKPAHTNLIFSYEGA